MNDNDQVVASFWSQVRKTDGCWLWMGHRRQWGHGSFTAHGRTRYAHRVSWELANGAIPEGLCVLHRCDVAACVNPDHLFLGTQSDNIKDAVRKGRWPQAKLPHKRKLTASDVTRITDLKASGLSQSAIARLLGVHQSTVSLTVRRKNKWLQEQEPERARQLPA